MVKRLYERLNTMEKKTYNDYCQILKEELVPAMGCTEPIALAYLASKCRDVLDDEIKSVDVYVSGNIIKNVKSVIVPNTNGLKGIKASVAAGIVAGKSEKVLEVIAEVNQEEKVKMKEFMDNTVINVYPLESDYALDMKITLYSDNHKATVRIASFHTNIVYISKDDDVLFESGVIEDNTAAVVDRNILNMKDIFEFANICELKDVEDILQRQIDYNYAIALEGIHNDWGANIGSTLLKIYGDDVKVKARAYGAAGSDARMSGCELPVIINSGSGNQGMTASIPVIVYAKELNVDQDKLLRSLIVSNLTTIHLKTGIGRLSAYCGAVSAGVGAGCGIAYMLDNDYKTITHTLVNAVAIDSGIICDGAKASCAAKIASSIDAGILGYYMYKNNCEFKDGDGIVCKGVENTIKNVSKLGKEGMKETDKVIIDLMSK
jgi:L-cysteine desulfidase